MLVRTLLWKMSKLRIGKHRDARKGRNPATNTEITIPAREGVPYAKFTKTAKE